LKRFSSYEELKNFVETNLEIATFDASCFPAPSIKYPRVDRPLTDQISWISSAAPAPFAGITLLEARAGDAGRDYVRYVITKNAETGTSGDYSTTNTQVEGIDEADIIKTDGKFIYVVSENRVVIVDAYPAENARVLSKIEVDWTPIEIFINGNKLVILGRRSSYPDEMAWRIDLPRVPPHPGLLISSRVFVNVYDITNKENPTLVRDISLKGDYFSSRMIGGYVYVVVNAPLNYSNGEIELPKISSNGGVKTVQATEIYHFDTFDSSYKFTIVLSIDLLRDDGGWSSEVFLMGTTQNIYVSPNNIYVACTKGLDVPRYWGTLLDNVMEILPDNVRSEINRVESSGLNLGEKARETKTIMRKYYENLSYEEKWNFRGEFGRKVSDVKAKMSREKTIIHRISISGGEIKCKCTGEVPGRVLNQFSMDEYQGYFRVATTTGWDMWARNNVYILDGGLNIVGRLENLAPTERIYSARFLGDKAYLVTFRRVDPFFVLDLSDPRNPKVLGELKIPGYSDYLHPYDETHIIGVGRDAGVKIALFDVSDPKNPKEISKYEVGSWGTYSYALGNHKAFLFSRSKSLLVMPIGGYWGQDAYVFHISVDNGIVLKGTVSHLENDAYTWSSYRYYRSYSIKRSLYIGNVLYTISDGLVKMNNLADLSAINSVKLPSSVKWPPIYYHPMIE